MVDYAIFNGMTLNDVLKNTSYEDVLFSEAEKAAVVSAVVMKETKGGQTPYVRCLIQGKEIKLTSEEVIRQLYLLKLMKEYGYNQEQFKIDSEVTMGTSAKRADIVIYEKTRPSQPYIIVELKSPQNPTAEEGKKQLESYCKFSGASIGVWTDGKSVEYLKVVDKV